MEQSRRIAPDQSDTVLAASEPTTDGAVSQGKVVVLAPVPTAAKWSGLLDRVRGAAEYIRAGRGSRAGTTKGVSRTSSSRFAPTSGTPMRRFAPPSNAPTRPRPRAEIMIRAAEERARSAEERAATAEEWLRRISETIESEFVMAPAEARRTAASGT